MKNKMKQLRKTAALCAVAVLVSGCSEDWSQVTIVDEGHAGAVQVGLEREETEFQTIHQETAAEGREETVAGEEEPIPETEPAETENVPFANIGMISPILLSDHVQHRPVFGNLIQLRKRNVL